MNILQSDENTEKIVGSLDVGSIASVSAMLKRRFAGETAISIDVSELDECDLTVVQLLESLRRSAFQSGRSVSLTTPASGALRQVLARGGFDRAMTPAQSRFWLHTSGDA